MNLERKVESLDPSNPTHNNERKEPEFEKKSMKEEIPQEESELDIEKKIKHLQKELEKNNNKEGWVG